MFSASAIYNDVPVIDSCKKIRSTHHNGALREQLHSDAQKMKSSDTGLFMTVAQIIPDVLQPRQ
jgi:hypothetical protein